MSARSIFPQTTGGSTSGDCITDLRAKLSATTLALHQTLDAVMAAFDKHTQELDGLRRALADAEAGMRVTVPMVAAVMKPMPMLPEIPSLAPLSHMPAIPAAPPLYVPATRQPQPAAAPMLTQILWPSKDSIAQNMAAPQSPVPMPLQPLAPVPTAKAPMLISSPAVVEPPAPPSPDLEQATLEELNAALAYAFSQVSNTTLLGKGAVTQMMPPQAMRFGNGSETSHRF